jgi:hypothetical protein
MVIERFMSLEGVLEGVWQRPCDRGEAMRRNVMLDSVRKHVAVPEIPVKVLLSVGSLASFGWLLSQDLVHPIVIYALQLYLSL